jgi:hypothetical protein
LCEDTWHSCKKCCKVRATSVVRAKHSECCGKLPLRKDDQEI